MLGMISDLVSRRQNRPASRDRFSWARSDDVSVLRSLFRFAFQLVNERTHIHHERAVEIARKFARNFAAQFKNAVVQIFVFSEFITSRAAHIEICDVAALKSR